MKQMAFSRPSLALLFTVGLAVLGDKFRELQLLYAATEEGVRYIFIPDPRKWPGSVVGHLRSKNLVRSEHTVNNVSFYQMNSFIVRKNENEQPATKATILRVDQDGHTEEFSGEVMQADDDCFCDVHSLTPKVASSSTRGRGGSVIISTAEARPEVKGELRRACRDGLSPIRPQEGYEDLALGDYSGVYDGKFTVKLTLFREDPPDLVIRECEARSLGTLKKVVYHKVCNFLIAMLVFEKDGVTYFFRVVLAPGLTAIFSKDHCKRSSSRSYDLVAARERPHGYAKASCSFHLDRSAGKFSSKNIMDWDSVFKVGFTLRPRACPRRLKIDAATLES